MMSVFEDGSTLALYRDPARSAAQIAKFSKRDADAFLRLSAQAAQWLPMLVSTLYTPPMPQGASFAFLDQSREGREFWRAMQMSSHDVLADYFEHDRVRAHFARVAGETRSPRMKRPRGWACSCSSGSSRLTASARPWEAAAGSPRR